MTKTQDFLCAIGVAFAVVGVVTLIIVAKPSLADNAVARSLTSMKFHSKFQPEVECTTPSSKTQLCEVTYSDLAELPVQEVAIEASENTVPFKFHYRYYCYQSFGDLECVAEFKSGLNPANLSREAAVEKVERTIELARAAAQTKLGTQYSEGFARFTNRRSY